MQIKVKLFTNLAKYVPGIKAGISFDLEMADRATISDLIQRLEIPEAEVKIIFVNGRNKHLDYELNNGDDIGIFPPIGGG